jgi:outer membrane protein TolC
LVLGSSQAAAQPDTPERRPQDPGDAAAPSDEPPLDPATKALAEGTAPDPLAEALRPVPGGLRLSDVVRRSARSSTAARATDAERRAAEARVDQAIAAFVPTVIAGASYTRMSEVENDLDIGIPLPPGSELSFPVIVNSYQLTASVEVPLSDYLVRLTQSYAAASLEAEAKSYETRARSLEAGLNGKAAYFDWIRAKGRVAVAELSVSQSERHLEDARATLVAGLISEVDVLRLEAQVALTQHQANAARALERVFEARLRVALHAPESERFEVGIDVLSENAPRAPIRSHEARIAALTRSALKRRLDAKALEKTVESLREVAATTRGSYYPRVAAFGNALYANPNPRVFPQENKWDFTWEVGVRMTWNITGTFATIPASREAEERALAAAERLRELEDGIRMAVTQAYYDILTARSAIVAAKKREEAALSNVDGRRKLFLNGKATATDMVDAEAELTQARQQRVDAHVDLLVSRARLDYALGKTSPERAP